MNHRSFLVRTTDEVSEILRRDDVRRATGSARSTLIQVFTPRHDVGWIMSLTGAIQALVPRAVIVGATSAGGISDGQVALDSTVLSLTWFHAADLHPRIVRCGRGEEHVAGATMAASLADVPHLHGLLLLATPYHLSCARLLAGICDRLPELVVFGGAAAGGVAPHEAAVVLGTERLVDGAVAVGLAGRDLHVDVGVSFGWKPLGPTMTLTEVEASRVLAIDHQPALDSYKRHLNIESRDDLYLLEVPLLIGRAGAVIARNPVSSTSEGHVVLVADVQPGERARFGYLDIDAVIAETRTRLVALEATAPEAIFLYACVCRRFSLQKDVALETLPFQQLAPTAGVYTHGEFSRVGPHLQVLNSSQVVVGLREGPGLPAVTEVASDAASSEDRYRRRHAMVTSRLFRLVGSITDELAATNEKLGFHAAHDALTGARNRAEMEAGLASEIARSRRHHHCVSIVMLDLDHFKRFNDEYGHAAGDLVLRSAADALQAVIRADDRLFRYGGEEFLILLPETEVPQAAVLAERARRALEELALSFHGRPLSPITASFGVASFPLHGDDAAELVRAADAALYGAKAHGRNRVAVASAADPTLG